MVLYQVLHVNTTQNSLRERMHNKFSTLVVTAPHHGGRGLSFVAFLAANVFHVLRVDPNVEWRSK